MGSGISYKNLLKYLYFVIILTTLLLWPGVVRGQVANQPVQSDTTRKTPLKLQDESGIPWEEAPKAPLFLDNPSNIKTTVTYDPDKNEYVIYQKVGT